MKTKIVVTLLSICLYLSVTAQLTSGLPKAVLYDKAGRSVSTASISDFDNPIIVVAYARSWCRSCVDFIDELDDEYSSLAGTSQVKLIAINVESDLSSSEVFAHANRWKHVEVLNDRDKVFMKAMNNNYLPKIFFMDGNQQVVYSHTQHTLNAKKTYRLATLIKRKEVTAENIYFDKDWLPCPASEAAFYRKLSKKPNGNWLINDYYKNGKLQMTGEALMVAPLVKQGKYSYYFEDGSLSSEANYNKDIPEDNYKEYYENGNLKEEYSYKDGKIEGNYKAYHKNGKKAIEGGFESGEYDGNFIYYHDNGKKRKAVTYSSGKLHGKCTGWYADGKLKYEAHFNRDELMKDPQPVYYHSNGLPAMEIKKDANGKNLVTYFYGDGKPWIVIEIVNDLFEYTEYFSNGKPAKKATMRDNTTVNGKYIAWYENGQKYWEATFFNNKPNGKAMSWYANGKPKEKLDYDRGTSEYFDEAGNKTSSLGEYTIKVDKGDVLDTKYLSRYMDLLSKIIKEDGADL